METDTLNYYKESGIAPLLSVVLVLICASVPLLIISYFYSLIINFIPFIYLNFLIVAVYGIVISYTSRIFTLIFKIRHRKQSILLTFLLSLLAIYFQWVSYIFIAFNEDFSLFMLFNQFNDFASILLSPVLVYDLIIEINTIGFWSLGLSKLNITGILLWGIWLAEALIIIIVACKYFTRFEIIPFSEKNKTWFKKEIIDVAFERIVFTNDFLKLFQSNPSQSILDLEKGNGLRYAQISIFSAPTESKSLITIDNIIISERGKGKKDVTPVLTHCYIDNIHLKKLRENYTIKKANIFEY
jgi:hypothetical protein